MAHIDCLSTFDLFNNDHVSFTNWSNQSKMFRKIQFKH